MKDLRGCLMKFSKTRMKVKILGTRGKIEESTPRHSQNSGERGRAPLKKLLFVDVFGAVDRDAFTTAGNDPLVDDLGRDANDSR